MLAVVGIDAHLCVARAAVAEAIDGGKGVRGRHANDEVHAALE
jgi:hypothetical protein